jgi:type IV pilus assembly protein PilB
MAAVIPAALAERTRALPLWREDDGTLVVACVDPTNIVSLDDVRLAAGARRIRAVVAPAGTIESALRKLYGFDQRANELIDAMDTTVTAGDTVAQELEAELSVSDAPVIRLAEGIIADAVDTRASDIHVEPGHRETAVRYRIDGVLHQVMTVPRTASGPLISRLKLMSGMDIAERRRPQDGRGQFRSKHAAVDLRVSSLPSLYGETIVIRLLRKGAEQLQVSDVGFTPEQMAHVLGTVGRPQGLVLITGPTGAGKTSTLYAFLGHLAGEAHNLITIEDPIEYELGGVNQTQVNDRIGFTFSKALRTVLRQDPDIVMVGEIRDPETAELALQASLTGHLVFSTLHTNDAPSAVVRLRDLGIPPYLITSSLSLIISQRLARRVCSECARPTPPTERQMAQLHLSPRDVEHGRFVTGAGCQTCNHTGYKGRTGIFEIPPRRARRRHAQPARGRPGQGDARGDDAGGGPAGHPRRPCRRRRVPGLRPGRRGRLLAVPLVRREPAPEPVHRLQPLAGAGMADVPELRHAGAGPSPRRARPAPTGAGRRRRRRRARHDRGDARR